MYRQAEQQTYKRKVAGLLDGMVQLARALDSVTGRKQVIFLSGGFNDAMLAGAEGSEQRANAEAVVEGRIWEVGSDTQFGDASVRQQLQKTLKTFAGTDCVVHTVDVTGLASSGSSVESAVGVDNRGRGGRQSLSQMAADTGGRFIKDTNDITGALAQILESSRRYYLLAFEPPQQKGGGRFHKLKVKVRRKGLSVSHRSGYLEAMPYAQRAPLVRKLEAAQMISSGVKGGAIEVQALAVPYRDARGRPVVAAVMEVDGTSLLDRPPARAFPSRCSGTPSTARGAWRTSSIRARSSTSPRSATGSARAVFSSTRPSSFPRARTASASSSATGPTGARAPTAPRSSFPISARGPWWWRPLWRWRRQGPGSSSRYPPAPGQRARPRSTWARTRSSPGRGSSSSRGKRAPSASSSTTRKPTPRWCPSSSRRCSSTPRERSWPWARWRCSGRCPTPTATGASC